MYLGDFADALGHIDEVLSVVPRKGEMLALARFGECTHSWCAISEDDGAIPPPPRRVAKRNGLDHAHLSSVGAGHTLDQTLQYAFVVGTMCLQYCERRWLTDVFPRTHTLVELG